MKLDRERIIDRMERLMKAAFGEGWGSLKATSDSLNIPSGVLLGYFKRRSLPDAENLYKIAQGLGVTVDFLLTGDDPDIASLVKESEKKYGVRFTNQERNVLKLWRNASEKGKEVAKRILESEQMKPTKKRKA